MDRDIIHPFGPREVVVTDTAGCFTTVGLDLFMNEHGTTWKLVAAYAPMSNGKAELMAGTIKKAVG